MRNILIFPNKKRRKAFKIFIKKSYFFKFLETIFLLIHIFAYYGI